MRSEIKLKYCRVTLNEIDEVDPAEYYATVEFEWSEDEKEALGTAFALAMDKVLLDRVRNILGGIMEMDKPEELIYLEDTWLMVNVPKDKKHLMPHLVRLAKDAEKEFDDMLE